MVNESTAAAESGGSGSGPRALTPGERARMSQCFARGAEALKGKPPNLDYAIEMFSIAVRGDPCSVAYAQALLAAIKQKHGPRKTGGLGGLFGGSGRGGLRKHAAKEQWAEVIARGIEAIKANPYDHGSLLAMAEAAGGLFGLDTQRVYLKAALDASPKDVEVNRTCAALLASQGEFDQAIACWVRIKDTKGLGEEAEREIARLQVDKTIAAGKGLTGRQQPTAGPGGTAGAGSPAGSSAGDRSPAGGSAGPADAGSAAANDQVAALRRQVKAHPEVIEPYLELADLLEREASIDDAEKVLAAALEASGNDLKIREHVEDRQLRWSRHKVLLAEQRLKAEDTPQARTILERLKAAQSRQEIEIFAARSARYPENVVWKYELAMRLKAAGNHAEAIRHFQEVLQDQRRRGAVSLELGECFQKIKQYELAMRNYETALELLTDREGELRKRALYRAGVLAQGRGDPDTARKHLTALAGLDFGYRDVAPRLDKLAVVQDDAGLGSLES